MSDIAPYKPFWTTSSSKISKQSIQLYKSKGYFDQTRRKLLEEFQTTKQYETLLEKVKLIIQKLIKENPHLLKENKLIIAALIETTIEKYIEIQSNYKRPSKNSLTFEINGKSFKVDMSDLGVEDLYQVFENKVKDMTTCSKTKREDLNNLLTDLDQGLKKQQNGNNI